MIVLGVSIANLQINFKLAIDHVLSFEMVAYKGRHCRMQMTAIMKDCKPWQIMDPLAREPISIWATDGESGKRQCIFSGLVDSLHIDYEGNVEEVAISAVSGSILLDTKKKSRSFQDTALRYSDVIHAVLTDTEGADALLHVQDKHLEKPVIQYEETDWVFIQRLASHLKTSIIPNYHEALPRFHIGLNNGVNIGTLDYTKYKTCFDPRYFTDGKLLNMRKPSFLYYDVDSFELYDIGDRTSFLGQELQICGLTYKLDQGILYCTYRLATSDHFVARQLFNDSFRGLSIWGTVLSADREWVRLHLDIDDIQNPETAFDYPWRPETGNLMYCMPEPGTRVSLHMQSTNEFCAVGKDCERTNGAEFPEAQCHEDRYLTTSNGKRVFWKPQELGFVSLSTGSCVKIDDAIGSLIDSDRALLMQADEDFIIDAKQVIINAPKEVSLIRRKPGAPTVINASYNFDIIGNRGHFFTNKLPKKPKKLSALPVLNTYEISDIADNILSSIPASFETKPNPVSAALQGTFVAHMPNNRRRG